MLNPLLLLRLYNQIHTFSDLCSKHALYIWKTLVDAYTVKTHLFFEGIAPPYNRSAVNIGAPSSAVPLWQYREDTKTFVEWSLDHQEMASSEARLQMNQLPILSMAIVDDERVVHDLTEFLASIRVFHSNPKIFPSVAHIIGAWSLSSGIVLNPSNNYFANSITISADTITIPINNNEYFHVLLADASTEVESTDAGGAVAQST